MSPAAIQQSFDEAIRHQQAGRLLEAELIYRKILARQPEHAGAMLYLGVIANQSRNGEAAVNLIRQAIALDPHCADAYCNLGLALHGLERFDEAIEAYRRAIRLNPNLAEAYTNLGNTMISKGRLDDAVAACRQALALRPDSAETYINLGYALKDKGLLDDAIESLRRAVAIRPDHPHAHSDLIFTMHYHPGYDSRAIAQELRRWSQQLAEPLRQYIHPNLNDRDPERRLRIGYVSPDFRNHPVGRNLLPLFQNHDRQKFEITAYADVIRPDFLTGMLQQNVDAWRDVAGISDQRLAEQIREDRIDILVDLTLHSGGNRLLVFARKPAPVQVSYLGYCGSTGLETIDYRISDPFFDPPGGDESLYSEKTVRLPKTYWCYHPGVDPKVEVSPCPALANGFVTFGCQNNYCKITPPVWNAWAAILRGVPNSKLLINCTHGSHRETARKILAEAGVNPNRLAFAESRNEEYFRCYNQIDIALDPFPFGGGTTTCDALWMGVPVVTLSGNTAVGRGGRSILSNMGLLELIASTPNEYVQIAVDLAGRLDRMDSLRRGMRARLQGSPLMDARQFARDMESAYRQMWRIWCQRPLATV